MEISSNIKAKRVEILVGLKVLFTCPSGLVGAGRRQLPLGVWFRYLYPFLLKNRSDSAYISLFKKGYIAPIATPPVDIRV